METLLIYFLKVNVAIAVLYLFFRLLFYRDTFFHEKRWTMLIGLFFAILYPLIDVSTWINESQTVNVAARILNKTLQPIIITSEKFNITTLETALPYLYVALVVVFILRILIRSILVLLMAVRAPKIRQNGLTIIQVQKGTSPFSFFGWVFLNSTDYTHADLEEILHHERAHIQQGHTFDVLFSEIVCAVFWINPFVWLLKCQLRLNLEFIADNDVLQSGFDSKSYQYHLLRLSSQKPISSMGNHFNITELKNRIIMMNKKKTSIAGLGKYALTLPLFALLLLTTYTWGSQSEATPPNNTKIDTVSITVTDIPSDKKAFSNVEQMPQFIGGEKALIRFVSSNLHYPVTAAQNNVAGRSVIRFIVSETGDITNVKVLKSLNPDCDAEAVRVISMMPKWKPGAIKGKNVPVYFTLPILFKLKK
jgi:TonB family protein